MSPEEESPEATRIRIVWPDLKWRILGLIVFGIVAFVGFTFLPWIVLGLFIYYVARPVSRRIENRIGRKGLSAALSLVVMVVPIVLFLGVFFSIAIRQISTFATTDTTTRLLRQSPVTIGAVPNDPQKLVGIVTSTLQNPSVQSILTEAQAIVGAAASSLFMLFLSLLVGFFLLVEDQRLNRWGRKQLLGNDVLAIDYLKVVDEG